MVSKRWQDWLLLLGGVWLFIAPWSLATTDDVGSSWNAWTLGVLVTATATWALARPSDRAAEWWQVLFGLWLFVAPWIFGFADLTAAAWNAWLLGIALVGMAWWALAEHAPTAQAAPAVDEVTPSPR